MGVFDVSYCTEADLRTILPNIADYDKKRVVQGWEVSSGNLYRAGSTGTIDMLYKNGHELGDAESVVGDVDAEGEWFYDSAGDAVYYYTESDPTGVNIKAGTDWATLSAAMITKASELVRSIVMKQIVPKPGGTFDQVIVLGTAAIAVGLLVRPHNVEYADELERKYNNSADEFPLGLLQLVNQDKIALHNEIHPSLGQGQIIEQSLNASTTGGIADTRGRATENDTVKVIIDNGDTFSYGSASAVTYSVWVKDSTGLMTSQHVTSETIIGDYQELAYGLELNFLPGVYTADDVWYIKISREPVETHQSIKTTQLTKN